MSKGAYIVIISLIMSNFLINMGLTCEIKPYTEPKFINHQNGIIQLSDLNDFNVFKHESFLESEYMNLEDKTKNLYFIEELNADESVKKGMQIMDNLPHTDYGPIIYYGFFGELQNSKNNLWVTPEEIQYGKFKDGLLQYGLIYEPLYDAVQVGNYKPDKRKIFAHTQSNEPVNESPIIVDQFVNFISDEGFIDCSKGIEGCQDSISINKAKKYTVDYKFGILKTTPSSNIYASEQTFTYNYVGQIKDDIPNGSGLIFYDGYRYIGEISDGLPNGIGMEDGYHHSFIGEYKDGVPIKGYLRKNNILQNNVIHYVGELNFNLRHGYGFLVIDSDTEIPQTSQTFGAEYLPVITKKIITENPIYFGSFENNEHTTGAMHWPDGAVYLGEFAHGGLRDGFGEMTEPDGIVSLGMFKDGARNGNIMLVVPDKGSAAVTFCNDQIIDD